MPVRLVSHNAALGYVLRPMTDVPSASNASLGLVERVAALHRVELFAGIPGRVLAAVAEAAVEVRASTGEVLMEEGAVEAHLYALVEGRVRVHRGGQTLVELGPGATVGELAALVPAPRTAWVTALEPTLVLRVDQAVLDDLLVDWPELAHGVIAALVSRLRAISEHAGQQQ
jgi:CRP/FNR family transcriptional regulator, cyclic AMP receptor protein